MRTYLVTGGCGFIGSHLVRELLAKGHKVVVLDDLSSGDTGNLPSTGVGNLVIGSVLDERVVHQLVSACDGVFHLAADVSVPRSVDNPYSTSLCTLMGTVLLMEVCCFYSKRIVYPSSAAVYGAHSGLCIETDTTLPCTPYGVSKRATEDFARILGDLRGLSYAALRLFNVYGERQNPNSPYSGVVSKFIDAAKRGDSVTVFGDGTQVRDFVYAGDVVKVMVEAMQRNTNILCNVASGESVSVLKLAQTVFECVGKPVVCDFRPARLGEVQVSEASTVKFRSEFDVKCTPLQVGLMRVIEEVVC